MELKRVYLQGHLRWISLHWKTIPDESCFKLMCHVHGEVVRRLHNPARTERKGRAFSCLYNQSGLCQSALSVETRWSVIIAFPFRKTRFSIKDLPCEEKLTNNLTVELGDVCLNINNVATMPDNYPLFEDRFPTLSVLGVIVMLSLECKWKV